MSSEDSASRGEVDRERRRRAGRMLGDLRPDTAGDESDEGWSEKEADTRDDEMRRDVPPHHGQ